MSGFGKLIERFNRWLAPAAVASAVEQGQGQPGTNVNAVGVKAIVTELEEPEQPGEGDSSRA